MIYYPEPNCVQIEPTFGCTRRCKFCGLTSLSIKQPRFMKLQLADKISQELGSWFKKKRIEFALRGEPTLHTKIVDIISLFRQNFQKSQLMLTTNGDIISKEKQLIHELFSNGLNILVIDIYDTFYKNIHFWKDYLKDININIYNFFIDKVSPYRYYSNKKQMIILMNNKSMLTRSSNIVRSLNNQAGNTYCPELRIYPLYKPKITRCQIPFNEISIFYDGKVPICCMDYNEQNIIGELSKHSLKDIWHSKKFFNIRYLLYRKRRDLLSPCFRCDYKGRKVGLLKDPKYFRYKEV